MHSRTRFIAIMAMLSAMAYLVMYFFYFSLIPAAPFLKYDPKDVFIVIGGFMYGPLAALFISLVVSFLEFITISADGAVGMLMNVLSSTAFACTAALIYKRWHNLKGAVAGLAAGAITVTAVMLLANYIITPMYRGVPRGVVAAMLVPVFLPFNLLKSGFNGAFVMMLYKPVTHALRMAGLHKKMTAQNTDEPARGKINKWVILISFLSALVLIVWVALLFSK